MGIHLNLAFCPRHKLQLKFNFGKSFEIPKLSCVATQKYQNPPTKENLGLILFLLKYLLLRNIIFISFFFFTFFFNCKMLQSKPHLSEKIRLLFKMSKLNIWNFSAKIL